MHKLGESVLSAIPNPRELAAYLERMYSRQYVKAKTDQERREVASWIRASRMNGNGRRK